MSNELSVTRLIDAAPSRVWDVLVNRTDEWWCPQPWRAEVTNWERRAGGRSEMVMYGPNGEVMPQKGTFLAWDEGSRIAFTDAIRVDPDSGDLEPAGPFMIGIMELAAEGDGTRFLARARHWTPEATAQHKEMGFETGWGIMADQLKALAEAA